MRVKVGDMGDGMARVEEVMGVAMRGYCGGDNGSTSRRRR